MNRVITSNRIICTGEFSTLQSSRDRHVLLFDQIWVLVLKHYESGIKKFPIIDQIPVDIQHREILF